MNISLDICPVLYYSKYLREQIFKTIHLYLLGKSFQIEVRFSLIILLDKGVLAKK